MITRYCLPDQIKGGGRLMNKVKLIKLPKDKDVGELGGIEGLKEITLL